jgi:hypothetical protein
MKEAPMTNNKQQTALDFVPYELALELKQIGHAETCFGWFRNTEFTISFNDLYPKERGEEIKIIAAPTYSQAFRFFRDKHNINAQIAFCEYSVSSQNSWKFTFDNPTNVLIWHGKFNTYEEAELECLKVLIEMVKTK